MGRGVGVGPWGRAQAPSAPRPTRGSSASALSSHRGPPTQQQQTPFPSMNQINLGRHHHFTGWKLRLRGEDPGHWQDRDQQSLRLQAPGTHCRWPPLRCCGGSGHWDALQGKRLCCAAATSGRDTGSPHPGKVPLVLPARTAWARARSSAGVGRQRICGNEKGGRCGGSQTRPLGTLALKEP